MMPNGAWNGVVETQAPRIPTMVKGRRQPEQYEKDGFAFEILLPDKATEWPMHTEPLCYGTGNDETDIQPHLSLRYCVSSTTKRWTAECLGDAHVPPIFEPKVALEKTLNELVHVGLQLQHHAPKPAGAQLEVSWVVSSFCISGHFFLHALFPNSLLSLLQQLLLRFLPHGYCRR